MTTPTEKAPFLVGAAEGRAPRLETLGSQMDACRRFLISAVRGMEADELAAEPGPTRNTVGGLLSHLAGAERMFQLLTSEGRGFGPDDEEAADAFWYRRDPLKGQGLEAYLAHLAAVRQGTRALFEARDDAWLDDPRTFGGRPANVHYFWTHLLMDEARHTGQVILLRKYLLPGASPDFEPYGGL